MWLALHRAHPQAPEGEILPHIVLFPELIHFNETDYDKSPEYKRLIIVAQLTCAVDSQAHARVPRG